MPGWPAIARRSTRWSSTPTPCSATRNTAHPKTSDEANAVMWLRYMFVYGNRDGLYLGRAIPRAWLARHEPIEPGERPDPWGGVSVRYFPEADAKSIRAKVDLKPTRQAAQDHDPLPPSGQQADRRRDDQRPRAPGVRCRANRMWISLAWRVHWRSWLGSEVMALPLHRSVAQVGAEDLERDDYKAIGKIIARIDSIWNRRGYM